MAGTVFPGPADFIFGRAGILLSGKFLHEYGPVRLYIAPERKHLKICGNKHEKNKHILTFLVQEPTGTHIPGAVPKQGSGDNSGPADFFLPERYFPVLLILFFTEPVFSGPVDFFCAIYLPTFRARTGWPELVPVDS